MAKQKEIQAITRTYYFLSLPNIFANFSDA